MQAVTRIRTGAALGSFVCPLMGVAKRLPVDVRLVAQSHLQNVTRNATLLGLGIASADIVRLLLETPYDILQAAVRAKGMR